MTDFSPSIAYQPPNPSTDSGAIGLIGAGSISEQHLTAYQEGGFDVVAIADLDRERAAARRDEYYPDAAVYDDHHDLLSRQDVIVADVATHPEVRADIVHDALEADKHVLSQKPFVLDLRVGQELVTLADDRNLKLAVNQNARWSPHFAYARNAIADGYLGDVYAAHANVAWDHDWVADSPFDDVHHVILYDFAIHWFDLLTCFVDAEPAQVMAETAYSPVQTATPPLLAQAMVSYDGAQASLQFDGTTTRSTEDRLSLVGSEGTLRHRNDDYHGPGRLTLSTDDGVAVPDLDGAWFPEGFRGTMAELLVAVAEDREPSNSARDNLASLELCFAAVASANRGEPVEPGSVTTLPDGD